MSGSAGVTDAELHVLILHYLRWKDHHSVHRYEQDIKLYFDLDYFAKAIRAERFDEADEYFTAFSDPSSGNPVTVKVLFHLRKLKYLRALELGKREKALDILKSELAFIRPVEPSVFSELLKMMLLGHPKEHPDLSNYSFEAQKHSLATQVCAWLPEIASPVAQLLQIPKLSQSAADVLSNTSVAAKAMASVLSTPMNGPAASAAAAATLTAASTSTTATVASTSAPSHVSAASASNVPPPAPPASLKRAAEEPLGADVHRLHRTDSMTGVEHTGTAKSTTATAVTAAAPAVASVVSSQASAPSAAVSAASQPPRPATLPAAAAAATQPVTAPAPAIAAATSASQPVSAGTAPATPVEELRVDALDLKAHDGPIVSLVCDKTGARIYTFGQRDRLLKLTTSAGDKPLSLADGSPSNPVDMLLTRNGNFLLVTWGHYLVVPNAKKWFVQRDRAFVDTAASNGVYSSLTCQPKDNNVVLVGTQSGQLLLFVRNAIVQTATVAAPVISVTFAQNDLVFAASHAKLSILRVAVEDPRSIKLEREFDWPETIRTVLPLGDSHASAAVVTDHKVYLVSATQQTVPPPSYTAGTHPIAAAAAVSSAGRDAAPVQDFILIADRAGAVTCFRSPQLHKVGHLQMPITAGVCCVAGAVGRDAQSVVVVVANDSGRVSRQIMPLTA